MLLEWHLKNRRIFPWRCSRDPYRVLVAELMLQRTQARQVGPVFETFVRRFPRPTNASEKEVSEIIKPLGLAHRAPRFAALMKKLSESGLVPDKMEELLVLPGVGRYVAGAVLCFGFGKDVAIVDVNVARVLSRVFRLKPRGRPQNDKRMLELAEKLVPRRRGPQYNEALLDFAALVCRPTPQHGGCPLTGLCAFYQEQKKQKGGGISG